MSSSKRDLSEGTRRRRWLRTIGAAVGFTAVTVLALLWLAGYFAPKIGPAAAHGPTAAAPRLAGDAPLIVARIERFPATEPAVGSIRAVHQAAVASKLLARVTTVNVQAGQGVGEGEVLVTLDDADLVARLKQAEASLAAAEARRNHARTEYERVNELFERGLANQTEWDRANADLKTAEAELAGAEQARREAETNLGYATIRSPISGRIVDKQVEAGDMVTPGQALLTIYDPDRMQLVARVRESLATRLRVGQSVPVRVDALGQTCAGQISEIVPEAEAASRSFSVKVTGPCPEGVYSGMFGRLLIPLEDEEVVLIPRVAVRRVGQLQTVDVAEPIAAADPGAEFALQRRVVQLGREFGDDVEVLSGLRPGERVALLNQAATTETQRHREE